MRRRACIIILLLIGMTAAQAQPDRIGAGLSFATKKRYFGIGDTGNPGLNLKTWISLDRKKNMFIVPSVTAFNPHQMKPNNQSAYYTTTYMFHGDVDFQLTVFQEKTLKVITLAGVNYSHVITKVTPLISINDLPSDDATFGLGPNIGAGLEMRMTSFFDFNVTGKYAFTGITYNAPSTGLPFLEAPMSAFIIQVHGVYYFHGRGKGYWR